MSDIEETEPTVQTVIDAARIGKRGCPRHYQAFGMEPPTKEIVVPPPNDDEPGTEQSE